MTEIPTPGDPGSTSLEVILHPTLSRAGAELQQIVRYVEALAGGSTQRGAAQQAGTTVKAMKLQGRTVQRYLAKARSEYTATEAEIRELTVLQWVERALREPTDPNYDARETMAALHELSLIPGVGLKGKTSAVATLGELSEETQQVLDSLDDIDA